MINPFAARCALGNDMTISPRIISTCLTATLENETQDGLFILAFAFG